MKYTFKISFRKTKLYHLFQKMISKIKNLAHQISTKIKTSYIHFGGRKTVYKLLRTILVLVIIFGGSFLINKKLTPPENFIIFKRECNNEKCTKTVDAKQTGTIENEIKELLSNLERIEFFAKFTFLRFDFKITNQSQLNFIVTDPPLERNIDIMMQCNLNGQTYIFSPGSGIIFKQKSSIADITRELNNIQNMLVACNPATQNLKIDGTPFEVAPGAWIKLIYNEEKYSLKFLPDKWNYWFTLLQFLIVVGIIYSGYYAILRFIKKGLK